MQPLTGALDTVGLLNPVTFTWIATSQPAYGLIAQEAVEVIPAMVSYDPKEDFWGIDYSKAVPYLIAAIQELTAQVTTLTNEVNALKGVA